MVNKYNIKVLYNIHTQRKKNKTKTLTGVKNKDELLDFYFYAFVKEKRKKKGTLKSALALIKEENVIFILTEKGYVPLSCYEQKS